VPSLQSVQFFPCKPHCPLLPAAFDTAQPAVEQLLKTTPPGPGKKTAEDSGQWDRKGESKEMQK